MFTRCPSCNSTFRVTASILQMAEGEVRCGACSGVFNALHTLVDDWSGTGFPVTPAVQLQHPEAGPDSAAADDDLEFNVPENEWQHFFIAPKEAGPAPEGRAEPGLGKDFDEAAEPGAGPGSAYLSTAADFAGEPEDGPDRMAADASPGSSPEEAGREPARDSPPDDAEPGNEPEEDPALDSTAAQPVLSPRSLEEETSDTDVWQAFLRETEHAPGPDDDEDEDAPSFVLGDEPSAGEHLPIRLRGRDQADETAGESGIGIETGSWSGTGPEPDTAAEEDEWNGDALEDSTGYGPRPEPVPVDADDGIDIPEPARPGPDTVLDWGPPPRFPDPEDRPATHTGRWLAASLLAALVLAGQGIHHFRDRLAVDPGFGPALRDLYGRIGADLHPDWPLAAFEVRGMKAIAENSAPDTLDIVAEIAVTGSQPVGLPLVRVVLRDRWSNAVASGVFDYHSYLADARPASGMYPPGTLIPVQISLKDPGSVAQGYEFDVCVPNRTAGLQCKSARDPFRR